MPAGSGNGTAELGVAFDAYQEVFCRMVAAADYCARLIEDADSVLANHVLTERAERRLTVMAAHPRMRVNTAIHRANRLAPLDQTLPLTCPVFRLLDRQAAAALLAW